ncbi:hypothetical protein Tco_1081456 [Tanacetum coccineum]|uniref:Uncharacterized protein n=1 Tax=Tanacetum coccineum TaxID=301880 RepID=A0ABQ5HXH1_9ASTR
MAETMEQYMSKTRTNYGSGVARPKIDNKDQFELKGQFLKELRENTFSGSNNEDANEHIEKVLDIVDLFHVLNITEIDSLKQDRAAVVSKFIPNAAMKLIRNDDLEEYDRASDALANASYPFLAEYVANPYASLEQLLSKKPPMLQSTFFGSRSKPLSSKVK